MIGAPSAHEETTRRFLSGFDVIAIKTDIAEQAVVLRRENRLKLPDAIVWASALFHGALLVTRDTKDFPSDHPMIRVPYKI